MKKIVNLCLILMVSISTFADVLVSGKLADSNSGNPVVGATVMLDNKQIGTLTDFKGLFEFSLPEKKGNKTIQFILEGQILKSLNVKIIDSKPIDLGVVQVDLGTKNENIVVNKDGNSSSEDFYNEIKTDQALASMDYSDYEDDDNVGATQSVSGLLSASGDIFTKQASFSFSPMRFNIRGYGQTDQSTYINGVYFNGLERGNFNYSMLGGLNKAVKRKEITRSLEANDYSFGSLGSTTNIDMRASNYAAGTNLAISASNRSYYSRLQALYATGLQQNGWAFAASAAIRYAHEGVTEGSPYESFGYFLSAEKRINDSHRLYFSTFGAPTNRGQRAAVTQETNDLIGNRYYNPYWGYQDGKKRNSRMVEAFAPTALLNYEWRIDDKQLLRVGASYQYSWYSNSALTFYNAPDPRPDYYRYLPSYMNDGHYSLDSFGQIQLDQEEVNTNVQDRMTNWWTSNNTDVTQLNWDRMYQSNYANNIVNPDGAAKYALERRHNDLMETAFNVNYKGDFMNNHLRLTAGADAKVSKGIHYKTMEDLLGANQWLDIDQFSERDLTGSLSGADRSIIENNIGGKKIIKEGDIFGNDYDINMHRYNAFVQNQWSFSHLDFFYGVQLTFSDFYRYGRMENGRAKALGVISKGKGEVANFLTPAFKGGITYKINGRHIIQANALYEKRAPLARNAYISPRIKDTQVDNLEAETVLSGDLSYNVRYPRFNARVTGFYTTTKDGVELGGFYNDAYRTFTNVTMTKVNKLHKGIEAAAQFKLTQEFSLVAAGTISDNYYTDDAMGKMSTENGANPKTGVFGQDMDSEPVLIKDLKVNSGPQIAGSFAIKYHSSKMWFADVSVNYFDNNYLDFAPSHFLKSNIQLLETKDMDLAARGNDNAPYMSTIGSQEKLDGGFMLNFSIGKLIYLSRKKAISINLSVNNILNEQLVTGGYQNGRIPTAKDELSMNVNKFPNKYYYNYGTNFYLNIGYRF